RLLRTLVDHAFTHCDKAVGDGRQGDRRKYFDQRLCLVNESGLLLSGRCAVGHCAAGEAEFCRDVVEEPGGLLELLLLGVSEGLILEQRLAYVGQGGFGELLHERERALPDRYIVVSERSGDPQLVEAAGPGTAVRPARDHPGEGGVCSTRRVLDPQQPSGGG